MKSRLFNVVVSGLVGGAVGFFAVRNEERKKYEKEMELKGYRLHSEQLPPNDRQTGTATTSGGFTNPVTYSWKKGEEEKPYDGRHRPFKF